jgi:hypothetical protein
MITTKTLSLLKELIINWQASVAIGVAIWHQLPNNENVI